MRLPLWKQILLSVLVPGTIALGIALYAIVNLGTISRRVSLIEFADDVNLDLLELRRYEKNVLLLYEPENVRTLNHYLERLEGRFAARQDEFLAVVQPARYASLLANYRAYRDAAQAVVRGVQTGQRLLEEIRPRGRDVERGARDKELALELRRHEKNFFIYREPGAPERVHAAAAALLAAQPALAGPVGRYLADFDAFVENARLKALEVAKIRDTGRAIQAVTQEFSQGERRAIEETIAGSRRLLVASLLLLLGSVVGLAVVLNRTIVGSLKSVEQSFADLVAGDFSHDVRLESANLPEEMKSFVRAYNETMHRLGSSREELQRTLDRLEVANRALVERQDELVEERKVGAMRLLASEVAHEINNPLSSVSVFLGAFYDDMEEGDPRRADIALMLNEVHRCQTVLRELADFARREPLKLKEVDPAALVREAVEVVTAQHRGKAVAARADLAALPARAVLDPVLVYQALVNVISNAFHFSPPGGVVEIRGEDRGETFQVAVTDRGSGIPPENIALVFQPFFTTRKESGGSGLGLAITKKIIERHGGTASIESRPGEGTTFTLGFPTARKEQDDAGAGG